MPRVPAGRRHRTGLRRPARTNRAARLTRGGRALPSKVGRTALAAADVDDAVRVGVLGQRLADDRLATAERAGDGARACARQAHASSCVAPAPLFVMRPCGHTALGHDFHMLPTPLEFCPCTAEVRQGRVAMTGQAVQRAHAADMLDILHAGPHRRARRGRARPGRAARSAGACWPAASARPAAASARATSAAWCTPAARTQRRASASASLLSRGPYSPGRGGRGAAAAGRQSPRAWRSPRAAADRNTTSCCNRQGTLRHAHPHGCLDASGNARGCRPGRGGRRAFFTPPNSSSSTLSVSE